MKLYQHWKWEELFLKSCQKLALSLKKFFELGQPFCRWLPFVFMAILALFVEYCMETFPSTQPILEFKKISDSKEILSGNCNWTISHDFFPTVHLNVCFKLWLWVQFLLKNDKKQLSAFISDVSFLDLFFWFWFWNLLACAQQLECMRTKPASLPTTF